MTVHHRKKVKASRRKERTSQSSDKARLNLLIDPELKEWAHAYAKRNHTSLSALITHHLVTLKWKEAKPDVQQI
jgi:predicted HicB family RNase H-like nuclease